MIYSVNHQNGTEVARCEDLRAAVAVAVSLGSAFSAMSLIGFKGVPHVNVIYKVDKDKVEMVMGIFVHNSPAQQAASRMLMNGLKDGESIFVRKILLNCAVDV